MKSDKVRVGILRGYGINAESELGYAFARCGGAVDFLHVGDVLESPETILAYSILAFPGGFSFGDHLGSGKVLSHLLWRKIESVLKSFIADETRLILGICNGFQTIAKMGLVPNLTGGFEAECGLLNNESGNFVDRWVSLRVDPHNTSPWLRGIESMRVPVRHGEGRFVTRDSGILSEVLNRSLTAFYYSDGNPNGSSHDIAGITDLTGRILGMMPHPEASIYRDQDPAWFVGGGKGGEDGESGEGVSGLASTEGLKLFENAIAYAGSRQGIRESV